MKNRSGFKSLRWWLAFQLSVVCTGGACLPFKRAATYPIRNGILDVDWYKPKEIVPGSHQGDLDRTRPDQVKLSWEVLQAVSRYAETNNSCALLVLHHDSVILEKYWCDLNPNSTPNAMSLTKTVLALLIGIAIEDGRIQSIEQPAADFLPEWAGDERREIKIRHLLQMASGLRSSNNPWNPFSDIVELHVGTETVEAALNIPRIEKPGARFVYNNVNSQVLGILLERATGQRFSSYLAEKIWEPLGADDAMVWLDVPGGMAKTYCCIFATTRSWARVGLLLLHHGRFGDRQLVPAAWIDAMRHPSPYNPNYGLHLWLGHGRGASVRDHWSEEFTAKDTFMLLGQAEQRVYVIPSRDLVIVRLGREAPAWDDPRIPNLLVNALKNNP